MESEEGRAGSTLDALLADECMLEESTKHAHNRVLSGLIGYEMEARSLTEAAMARQMRTSRARREARAAPRRGLRDVTGRTVAPSE